MTENNTNSTLNNKSIYLDYQSTTCVPQEIIDEMQKSFAAFSNPHSRTHHYGWDSENLVEEARKNIADMIGATSKEIVFTSGATESNNLAIKGYMSFMKENYPEKNHIITLATEHKCVLESCRYLQNNGFKVTFLPVQGNGMVDLEVLKSAITENTALISIMAVHNEIGVIQPLKEIGEICKDKNITFHSDIAQGYGKIPINVKDFNIGMASISGHKIYGPMGVGALYISSKKPKIRIHPLFSGGGQERGFRSGTVPTPLVVGLGKATEIASKSMEKDHEYLKSIYDFMVSQLKEHIPGVIINGDEINRFYGNLNISFPYVEGESIIAALKSVAVSSGSACTSSSLEPSYVLHALGRSDELAHSSIRFGFGRFTTMKEVQEVIDLLVDRIPRLIKMSPLWIMEQKGIDLSKYNWSEH
ncbi:MAG: IscS subfamily cysteine desulfurase [Anaplasmataceae bacterium]|nr:IscS subfamily cysteine desulfurase [Anaplasmataceae bacterium]